MLETECELEQKNERIVELETEIERLQKSVKVQHKVELPDLVLKGLTNRIAELEGELDKFHEWKSEQAACFAFDKLIDNAATCSQEKLLVDDESLRECIKLNIYDPLLAIIDADRAKMQEAIDYPTPHSDYAGSCKPLTEILRKRLAE